MNERVSYHCNYFLGVFSSVSSLAFHMHERNISDVVGAGLLSLVVGCESCPKPLRISLPPLTSCQNVGIKNGNWIAVAQQRKKFRLPAKPETQWAVPPWRNLPNPDPDPRQRTMPPQDSKGQFRASRGNWFISLISFPFDTRHNYWLLSPKNRSLIRDEKLISRKSRPHIINLKGSRF